MGNKIATEKTYRINGEITAQEVRLIGVDNEQIGVVTLREAFKLAEEADVDIVEMSPTARPPVCRLMDYGKFRYAQQKKAHEAKLKQKVISVKEIKFRPGTDEGDYNIKLRNVIKFLEDDGEITTFLEHAYALGDASVKRYMERGFTNLSVCFGCTGGQHRSVYCAQHLAEHLNQTFGVQVNLTHREQNIEQNFKAKH